MTDDQKEFISHLLQGKYVMFRMSNEGKSVYMVYEGKQVPVKYYSRETGDYFKDYLKKDKKNRLTLNLNQIRQVDGRNPLKKAYREIRSNK